MVNDLKIKRETLIRKFNKNAIIKTIKNMLPDNEIMFMYFGGSIAYDTFNADVSDVDICVFVNGPLDYTHMNAGNYDLFIFGKDLINRRHEGTNILPEYSRMFIDDKFSVDSTLIYLNKKYEKEFNDFKNFNLVPILKEHLYNVYRYYMFFYIDSSVLSKRFYHVIRVRGQIENYKKTGVFDLNIPEEYRKEMNDFKMNYANDKGKQFYLKKVGQYLEEIKAFEEGLT